MFRTKISKFLKSVALIMAVAVLGVASASAQGGAAVLCELPRGGKDGQHEKGDPLQ